MKKFKKVYLHIGLEKTGTTSIQRALDIHRKKLEPLGYFYPKATAVGKNVLLAAMFNPELVNRPVFNAAVERNGGTWPIFSENLQEQLQEEYNNTSAENLILSSEFIAVHTKYELVKAYCDEIAEETVVVFYLREQAALLMSLYSTFIKGGGVEFGVLQEIEDGILPTLLQYKVLIERLEKTFGDCLKVKLFDRDRLVSGNVIHDFLDVIGITENLEEYDVDRQNESLSLVGTEFLKAVNPYLPIVINGDKNRARDGLINDISKLDATGLYGKARLSTKTVKIIQKLSKPDNKWIREKYFPNQKTLFKIASVSESQGISEETTLQYSAQLVASAYGQIRKKQDVLNESAPELKKVQNDLNRSLPAMQGVGTKLKKTIELRHSAKEKLDDIMPVVNALEGKFENVDPMMIAVFEKLNGIFPMLDMVHEKINLSLPVLTALKDRLENTENMVSTLRAKLDNTVPVLNTVQKNLSNLDPEMVSLKDKIENTSPVLDAIQNNLDSIKDEFDTRGKNKFEAVFEKLERTSALRKSASSKVESAAVISNALAGKVDGTRGLGKSAQEKLESAHPITENLHSKLDNVGPMLAAVQEKLEGVLPMLNSLQEKANESAPLIQALKEKTENTQPMLDSVKEKLRDVGPVLNAMHDNLDDCFPKVKNMHKQLKKTGPTLNGIHENMLADLKREK